jgi:hypothetical protein
MSETAARCGTAKNGSHPLAVYWRCLHRLEETYIMHRLAVVLLGLVVIQSAVDEKWGTQRLLFPYSNNGTIKSFETATGLCRDICNIYIRIYTSHTLVYTRECAD